MKHLILLKMFITKLTLRFKTMVEIEYKFLINSNEYELINDRFSRYSSYENIIQTNYYYDTSEFYLYSNNITFRVREKKSVLNAELKYPIEKKGALTIKKEYEKRINTIPTEINLHYIDCQDIIEEDRFLFLKGFLITQRITFFYDKMISVCLDKNYYNGITDYELEIEFLEGGIDKVEKIIETIDFLNTDNKTEGKNHRFFKSIICLQKDKAGIELSKPAARD